MQKYFKPEHLEKLVEFIRQNKKVDGIKFIRDVSGLGLKESKDLFEDFYFDNSTLDEYVDFSEETEDAYYEEQEEYTKDQEEQILDERDIYLIKTMLAEGQKLNAVKYVKEKLNTGLKESKEFVDMLEDEEGLDSKKETFLMGEDESLIVELDTEKEEEKIIEKPIEMKKENKMIHPEWDDNGENRFLQQKRDNVKSRSDERKEPEIVIFDKVLRRERNIKKVRNNSGCMLTMTVFIITGIIVFTTIFFT